MKSYVSSSLRSSTRSPVGLTRSYRRRSPGTTSSKQNHASSCNVSIVRQITASMAIGSRAHLALLSVGLLLQLLIPVLSPTSQALASPVLMRVCDTREVKTVTSRVCMLYKRTKNSDVKLDRQGNLRITRQSTKGEYSPAKLASDCCKIGCPPHIFANIC